MWKLILSNSRSLFFFANASKKSKGSSTISAATKAANKKF
jgi:hypothetical protein